jgi:hypothetical protein
MLASHFNSTTPLWTSGNFNYDTVVNALDFNAIATNFGASFSADPVQLGSLVPEPATILLLAVAPLVRRRRRDR